MSRRGKNKGARAREAWTPFVEITAAHSQQWLEDLGVDEVWSNARYCVFVHKCGTNLQDLDNWPQMIHLSIKRHDRTHLAHDWRDMQRIKNEIVGERNEAVELFPSEDRLVDGANQFHLWVIEDPDLWFPFGFPARCVADESLDGSKQRRFENPPDDLLSPRDIAEITKRDNKLGPYLRAGRTNT